MIKAIVFDMDGVLFDTERISCECCFEAARLMGLEITEKAVYGCFGLNAADARTHIMGSMEEKYPNGTFPYDSYRECLDGLFAKRLENGAPVMPGVRELLTFLKEKGIRVALASSTHYERIMSNLTHAGLEQFFEVIVSGNMVEHSKPLPDIYLKACAELGVEPAEAAAVEDSPNGIRSAAAAGMFTIMVPDLLEPTDELAKLYDLKCGTLAALQAYLEKENASAEAGGKEAALCAEKQRRNED